MPNQLAVSTKKTNKKTQLHTVSNIQYLMAL